VRVTVHHSQTLNPSNPLARHGAFCFNLAAKLPASEVVPAACVRNTSRPLALARATTRVCENAQKLSQQHSRCVTFSADAFQTAGCCNRRNNSNGQNRCASGLPATTEATPSLGLTTTPVLVHVHVKQMEGRNLEMTTTLIASLWSSYCYRATRSNDMRDGHRTAQTCRVIP